MSCHDASTAVSPAPRAQFIPGRYGLLFALVHRPGAGEFPTHWVLHSPAFAEEMNKSRPMVAAQARRFTQRGYGVLLVDLYGTGDSEGDLSLASWSCWLDDLAGAIAWLKSLGADTITLWGLRLGCLLALDLLASRRVPVDGLLLWQPICRGQLFLNQFLRLRVAASMMSGVAETTALLRARLNREEHLEVAGYDISQALFQSIEGLSLTALRPLKPMPVHWIELVAKADKGMAPSSRQLLEVWAEQGQSVSASTVEGHNFWASQEISMAASLLSVTESVMPVVSAMVAMTPSEPALAVVDLEETPLQFPCGGAVLLGVLHQPREPALDGVLLIVGGPQYRVGSHRQFLLLARALSAAGIAVLRFDCRGMGDSEGQAADFMGRYEDIRAALDIAVARCPRVAEWTLWGLCDGATAALAYAAADTRVSGLVLLNPWLHSEAGAAQAYLKHYYLQRLLSRYFWSKIFAGEFKLGQSWCSLKSLLARRFAIGKPLVRPVDGDSVVAAEVPLVETFYRQLSTFSGRVLLILSGNDLTAAEFVDTCRGHKPLGLLLRQLEAEQRLERCELADADHTFSRRCWRDQVAQITARWINGGAE